jgi:NAD(P)-dependent dehydrogenase (short-subunit alcohol dehydrogenase family)
MSRPWPLWRNLVARQSASVVAAGVTNGASMLALFDTTLRHFDRVDVFFSNAGISTPAVLR